MLFRSPRLESSGSGSRCTDEPPAQSEPRAPPTCRQQLERQTTCGCQQAASSMARQPRRTQGITSAFGRAGSNPRLALRNQACENGDRAQEARGPQPAHGRAVCGQHPTRTKRRFLVTFCRPTKSYPLAAGQRKLLSSANIKSEVTGFRPSPE